MPWLLCEMFDIDKVRAESWHETRLARAVNVNKQTRVNKQECGDPVIRSMYNMQFSISNLDMSSYKIIRK